MTISAPSHGNAAAKERPPSKRRHNFYSFHSPLTHAASRHNAYEHCYKVIAMARTLGRQAAILYLDLDRFKNINASLGYRVGDGLLLEVGKRLHSVMAEEGCALSFGGDKFIFIQERVEDVDHPATVAHTIIQQLTEPFEIEQQELFISASIGISLFPVDSMDSDGLLRAAEKAMYRAKDMGGNNYQFYTSNLNNRCREYLEQEYRLRRALYNEQLIVHFQPQFELFSRKLVGSEALVRWQDPERGVVPPGDFIPLAEETGLIVTIGEWVLRAACAQNSAWQRAGCPPLPVAVNISPRQFVQPGLVQMIADILAETGLEASYLELEITETTLMKDMAQATAVLQELRDMGVRVAIDDFGSGYSALAYLNCFPVDKIKIDQSFIRHIDSGGTDTVIVGSINAIAHSMELEVIAEGVETEAQLKVLKDQGCEYGQGFLFSKPLSVEEFTEFFRRIC